jgi:hypothetical protein
LWKWLTAFSGVAKMTVKIYHGDIAGDFWMAKRYSLLSPSNWGSHASYLDNFVPCRPSHYKTHSLAQRVTAVA